MADLTDMQILKQMFQKRALIAIKTDSYGKRYVTLQETQSPDSQVEIRRVPNNSLVLNIDDFMSLDGIFNGSHGECKRADYVIISEEKKCIIFIEMKRKKDEWHNIVKQLQGSKCFMDYCQNLGQTFWQDKDFLTGYQYRFVSLGHTNIVKKKTRIDRKSKQGKKHNTPDTALKIDYAQSVQFNMIASVG